MSDIKNSNGNANGGGRPRGTTLNRPCDVKRLLNRWMNYVQLNKSDKEARDVLRALTYASQAVLTTFQIGEFEERLRRLEEHLELKK